MGPDAMIFIFWMLSFKPTFSLSSFTFIKRLVSFLAYFRLPGLGRSAGEGIGYPLQYSWASLVAQLVKNLPTMRETWVWSLGREDPLEESMATPVFLPGESHGQRSLGGYTVHGVAKSWTRLKWQWKQCQTLFFWAPKSLQMVTAAMKLKDAYSLEEKLWPT